MAAGHVTNERFARLKNLVKAVRKGCLSEVQELFKAGVNVNCTAGGITPLHVAAVHNHVECAEFLLQNGALVNQTIADYTTPLHVASRFNSLACVVLFINYGADVKAITRDGLSALHLATRNGNPTIAEVLIAKGAEVNHVVKQLPGSRSRGENLSPLHFSARHNHADCIEILARYGGNLNMQSGKVERTPLHTATQNNHLACSCVLLSHGANVNLGDFKGNTALHLAATLNDVESTELLLQAGADLEYLNNAGKKAVDLSNEHLKTVLEPLTGRPKSLMFICVLAIRKILFSIHGTSSSLDKLAEVLPLPETIKLKICLKNVVKM